VGLGRRHWGGRCCGGIPTQLDLPVVRVLADGTYLSVLVNPRLRGKRREQVITAARNGEDLDPDDGYLVRVIEYDVPDREGNGTGELIVLLTTITDPGQARADELADTYHQRWEQETGHDQLKPTSAARAGYCDHAYLT
jgi:hypothetical protein